MSYGKLGRYLASVLTEAGGEDGQALVESSLVLVFIALAAVVAVTAVGLAVSGFYESFAGLIS
jgi:Flp pilus assembly pilin Flp